MVNQSGGNIILGCRQRDEAVGIGVELVHADIAACAHLLADILPQTVDIGGDLLTVGIAHLLFGKHFGGTLVSTHLGHLHLHAKLCHDILDEQGLGGQTMPVELTVGIEVHLVGH